MKPLPEKWFEGDAVALAPKLLGKVVKRGSCAGIIVETEAYTTDGGSHAQKKTLRSLPMFETHGCWYVYFTYGMHWCANVTTNKGSAGAVLIRAVAPVEGLSLMQKRRARKGMAAIPLRALANGPAKFCQAFGVTGRENTRPLGSDFAIYDAPPIAKKDIGISARIGLGSRPDAMLPWRFFIKDNPFVSR